MRLPDLENDVKRLESKKTVFAICCTGSHPFLTAAAPVRQADSSTSIC